jgi:hypothetical protein
MMQGWLDGCIEGTTDGCEGSTMDGWAVRAPLGCCDEWYLAAQTTKNTRGINSKNWWV